LRRTARARLSVMLEAQDREDLRWYLEDYLQYPVAPTLEVAARVESRLAELGAGLFRQVFEANRDTMRLWDAVAETLPDTRIEIDAGVEAGSAVPWELLRDPVTNGALALRAAAFVRSHPEAAVLAPAPKPMVGGLRALLVICRPSGRDDVPFRSVASHLVRLSRRAREAFRLDVLRPPTFAQLTRVLEAARAAGEPYQVVHFDGHGAWLDAQAAAGDMPTRGFDRNMFSLASPPRMGSHGFLVFEDPGTSGKPQLVDGPALGALLADAGVGILVLNACRSAHADLVTSPETEAAEMDAHGRVRAYGSLAQEVMDAGVAGVVAMRYNVYVVTAAKFIAEVYGSLLAGQPLGSAVATARRQLAADPQRKIGGRSLPLQDWMVPVVYESAPLTFMSASPGGHELSIDLSKWEAGRERAGLEAGLPTGPDAEFIGRDETLLALDRAFDRHQVVVLHAWAGAGKTSTALEFARWYMLTGGTGVALFTSFEHHLILARLLDQIGDRFGPALERSGVHWAVLSDRQRREVALQVLAQVPVLWIWDNVEAVAGFPADTPSAWTKAQQDELASFLRDLSARTISKALLTSRRDERAWLGDLPARVMLPPMPMLERLELVRAIAARQADGDRVFLQVEDWRPLLEFTQGNPLTVIILTRQAIRGHHTTRKQIEGFIQRLRDGAASVTDDDAQGRNASLTASLDYGFTRAFTEDERSILALLSLFQGFIDIDILHAMGSPNLPGGPVRAVAGMDRDTGIALLDRVAEVGLLTSYGDGYYAVHPAIPLYLHVVFKQHYGPDDSPAADHAILAWTIATSKFGDYYLRQFDEGYTDVIGVLEAQEANLLRARQLALSHHWPDFAIGAMQGLRTLYEHTMRLVEWRRLVEELVPEFTDLATGGPLPDREQHWSLLTEYRISFASYDLDWSTARQLQESIVAWRRQRAAAALSTPDEDLGDQQCTEIRNVAVALEQLGHILRQQDNSGCLKPYAEAMELHQRIGYRYGESFVALNLGHAYKDVTVLRDLDKAEHWYRCATETLEEQDTVRRGEYTGQLGDLAYERFRSARPANAPKDQLLGYLNDAIVAYTRALALLPDHAVKNLAVIHHGLGNVYGEVGDTIHALAHYQQAIQHREHEGNRFQAGIQRYNAAIVLRTAGRPEDALLYVQAALRDYEAAGPGAASLADQARQLVVLIEHEQADKDATS
jgi:tetratricopeptide (TPR) repeat protein